MIKKIILAIILFSCIQVSSAFQPSEQDIEKLSMAREKIDHIAISHKINSAKIVTALKKASWILDTSKNEERRFMLETLIDTYSKQNNCIIISDGYQSAFLEIANHLGNYSWVIKTPKYDHLMRDRALEYGTYLRKENWRQTLYHRGEHITEYDYIHQFVLSANWYAAFIGKKDESRFVVTYDQEFEINGEFNHSNVPSLLFYDEQDVYYTLPKKEFIYKNDEIVYISEKPAWHWGSTKVINLAYHNQEGTEIVVSTPEWIVDLTWKIIAPKAYNGPYIAENDSKYYYIWVNNKSYMEEFGFNKAERRKQLLKCPFWSL